MFWGSGRCERRKNIKIEKSIRAKKQRFGFARNGIKCMMPMVPRGTKSISNNGGLGITMFQLQGVHSITQNHK